MTVIVTCYANNKPTSLAPIIIALCPVAPAAPSPSITLLPNGEGQC